MAGAETRKLQQLAEAWLACQPLSAEVDRRLWKKLRLDWNYHSNHIEGNTLTYGETELLLKYNQTRGGHDLREYEEMKAHDVVITRIRDLARDGRPLTESEIRTWNEIILKEPFWKQAITPLGAPTRKQIVPGRYKSQPNSVLTPSGEIYEFAAPLDVPPKMSVLIDKINRIGDASLEEMISGLAEVHHEFVVIHPFDDGNGRVARLIVNFLLIRRKLVPLVVPSDEKKRYITALQQADDGSLISLTDYFGEKMVTALELGLKAARGDNIEDLSDVEKRVLLLEREMEANARSERPQKNANNLQLVKEQLGKLVSKLEKEIHIFDRIFRERRFNLDGYFGSRTVPPLAAISQILEISILKSEATILNINIELIGYLGVSNTPFNVMSHVEVILEQFQYRIVTSSETLEKSYADEIAEEEVENLVHRVMDEIVSTIERQTKK